MPKTQKTFGAYTADMEPNDRESFDCFVTHTASGDCNSLAWLDGEGEFDTGRKGPTRQQLDAIEAWALANGY